MAFRRDNKIKSNFSKITIGLASPEEILTVKSDDVTGRARTYDAIVKGEAMPTPGLPESLNVLLHELQGLALSITME